MNTALEPYRRAIIRPLLSSETMLTAKDRQAAITATVALWGIDIKAEEDNPAKLYSATMAAGLLVLDQAPQCLKRIEKNTLTPHQLELLNETYDIDGIRLRLGNMTPRQATDIILAKLVEQQHALATQIRQIKRLLKRCLHEDRLISEQI
jgi:hypothetical protein